MVNEAEDRIAERNAIADERYHQQGPVGQGMNRVGLAAANAMDRVHAPLESHTGTFLAGAALGIVAGAGLGLVAWMIIFGTFGVMGGGAGLLTLMGIGAVAMGLHEGNDAVKRHVAKHGKKHVSDRVAEAFGVVGKSPQEQSPEDLFQHFRWQEREHRRRTERQHHHHQDLF